MTSEAENNFLIKCNLCSNPIWCNFVTLFSLAKTKECSTSIEIKKERKYSKANSFSKGVLKFIKLQYHNILAASKQIILFFGNAKIFQKHFSQREIFCEGK